MPIAFASISSPSVDHHSIATTNDERIEDVDPVVPNVNPEASDVVRDKPLGRSERVCSLAISDNYIVYLQEHAYDVGDLSNSTTYKEAIVSPQSNFWIDVMKDEMTSMSHNKV